jgi:kynurenine formamidase
MEAIYHEIEEIKSGEIVIFHTGIWNKFGEKEFTTDFCSLNEKTIEYLIDKDIKAFGTDAVSVDPMENPSQKNHKLLLGAGIPIIEALTNLSDINKTSFFFAALPLKISGHEAAPCRAVAFINMDWIDREK